jgi:parallel beta-helix repeat protein
MAHDVFISYASQDKLVADAVCSALESENIRCWFAPRDIPLGEHWAASINNAIKTTSIMVLIFSENSNQSDQVINELTLAVKSKVTVIPFKIEDALPQGVMEYYLAATHWLDAMNPPTKKQIDTLVEKIKSGLGVKQAKVVATHGESQEVTASIPEIKQRPEKETPVINKKTGLAVVAVLACALLLFGGYRLLNPVSENDAIEAVAEVGSDQQAVQTTAPPKDEAGNEIVVTSTADSGDGTLRWALQTARYGDTIIFDPGVFPPDEPDTIYIKSKLPELKIGNLTIDASNAGVIIDARYAEEEFIQGLVISSSGNRIMGLQIVRCFHLSGIHPGAGIIIVYGSNNIIGGDRSIGSGPIGQGNLVAGNDIGIELAGGNTGYQGRNIVTGNLIGTDLSGSKPNYHGGNGDGLSITWDPTYTTIGPDNIIAFNTAFGIVIGNFDEMIDDQAKYNTITANSIYDNRQKGILVQSTANNDIAIPVIKSVNLEEGTVQGITEPGYTIEIFSDSGGQGKVFEGSTEADGEGNFIFSADRALKGPNITATATDKDGNTSEFSAPYFR